MMILIAPSPSIGLAKLTGRVAVPELDSKNSALADAVVLDGMRLASAEEEYQHTSSSTALAGLSVLLYLINANAVVASTASSHAMSWVKTRRLFNLHGLTNLTLSRPL